MRAQFVQYVVIGSGQPADVGWGGTGDFDAAVIGDLGGHARSRQQLAEALRVRGPNPDKGPGISLDEFIGCGVGEQTALVDHDQVIRGHRHLSHQVTGNEYGPTLGRQSPQELAKPMDALRIEAIGRFVEHQGRRVAEQRDGETETLAPLVLLVTIPLVWRRRWPLLVMAVVFIGAAIAREAPSVESMCAAVAAYSVGTHERRRIVGIVELAVLGVVVIVAFGGVLPSIPAFIAPFALLFAFWTVGALVRQGRVKADAMTERARRVATEQQLVLAVAQAEERARIARELHDVVAHSVSLLVIQAGAARQVVERTPDRAISALDAVGETGRQALQELRTILGVSGDSGRNRDPQPTLAEVPAIVRTITEAGLPVTLEVRGPARLLPAGLELTAFRVIQEALTNALKHSCFAPMQVVIEYRPHEVVLEVLCNGPVKSPSVSGGGRGLAGMKDRVAIVGGRLEAEPGDDRGFNVRAWLPIDPLSGGEYTA